jgi:hypothetical protein
MTEMEMNVAGEIMAWALLNPDFENVEDISTQDLSEAFWKEKLNVVELKKTVYDSFEIVY